MLVMELFYILKSEESRGHELERNQRIDAYNSRISFDFLYKPERLQIITSYIILSHNLSSWRELLHSCTGMRLVIETSRSFFYIRWHDYYFLKPKFLQLFYGKFITML